MQEPYLTKKQVYLLFSIIILGIFLRWYQLDERPYHHDESLHAIHGYYVYTDPDNKFYRYDPLLHGPLLYNLYPFVYDTFGISNWSGRFVVAFLGSLFIFVPLLFRRFFTAKTLLFLTTAVSLSPSLIFWSRFARHDFLMISCMLLLIHSFLNIPKAFKGGFFLLFLILPLCIKENSYILYALLLGYISYQALFFKNKGPFSSPISYLKENYRWTLAGLAVTTYIYCYLFSGGFRYSEGILDGLFRKSLIYWWNQHDVERIKGPFLFYTFNLAWYEFLFFLGIVAQTFYFYTKVHRRYLFLLLSTFVLSSVLYFNYDSAIIYPIRSFFKTKFALDLFFPLLFLVQGLITTTAHLEKKEFALSFFGYWFWASLFTYSFLGEKVPWLTSYIFIPGVIYLALYGQNYFSAFETKLPKRSLEVAFILFILFNLRMSIITNFSRAGHDTEYFSQVHTSQEFHKIAEMIREEMVTKKMARQTTCLGLDDSLWPLSWYMRDQYPLYQFSGSRPYFNYENFDYVFINKENPNVALLEKTHHIYPISLRHWWVPDFDQMSLKNFMIYALFHVPWNESGRLTILYGRKKDL